MPDRVGVVLYGFGRVGRATLELALQRPWIDVRGIVVRSPASEGTRAADIVPGAPTGLALSTDAHGTLHRAAPEVVLVATVSTLPEVLPHLRDAAENGARAVVCTAEELAHARLPDSPEAAAIHALATANGTAVVATGVNPGFVLDLWPLVLSGLAWDVKEIRARRVVDVSPFAPHTRRRLGIGHSPEAFERGVQDGSIAGHVGFRESLRILTESLGRKASAIEIRTSPIVADRRYELADSVVEEGQTVGANQIATAIVGGRPWITVEFLLHAAAAEAGLRPRDEAHIFGRHELHATIEPGCSPVIGTAATLINSIQGALAADPGVYGPGDLPPATPWLAATRPGHGRTGSARRRAGATA